MANLNINQLPPLGGAVSDTDLFILQSGIGTFRVTGAQLREAFASSGGGGSGIVETVEAGLGISVDSTDPANPIVSNAGVVSISAGTNVSINPTGPGSYQISATGGGGGGGGATTFVQIAKITSPATLTGAEIMEAGATPYIITNQSNVDLNLGDLNGTYLVVFNAFGVSTTLTNPTGANMFDRSNTPVDSLSLDVNETIQLVISGAGGNWSANVLARY